MEGLRQAKVVCNGKTSLLDVHTNLAPILSQSDSNQMLKQKGVSLNNAAQAVIIIFIIRKTVYYFNPKTKNQKHTLQLTY